MGCFDFLSKSVPTKRRDRKQAKKVQQAPQMATKPCTCPTTASWSLRWYFGVIMVNDRAQWSVQCELLPSDVEREKFRAIAKEEVINDIKSHFDGIGRAGALALGDPDSKNLAL
jgi:hypothetical protein